MSQKIIKLLSQAQLVTETALVALRRRILSRNAHLITSAKEAELALALLYI